ncbi:ABC transporter ATP-binding protein [Streptomyces sp. NPDC005529]|uniref:ABC transporter ATP-binding protein n=1 Tax=unclassified Streptomyces TaxID=2593676 RepID=UPI0033ADF885
MGGLLLELSGVTVQFGGVLALDRVDLSVRHGQVIGVIGPNGAGKSTLFNVVCGFLRPDAGVVSWRGQALQGHRPQNLAKLGIARTLQGMGLFPRLTVLENVMAGAGARTRTGVWSALLGLPRGDREEAGLRECAMERLVALGIGETADRLPDQLSYGTRKRVALARALVSQPQLLLLDEPAAGLSVPEIDRLTRLLPYLSDAVVLVEHRVDLVLAVCDEVVVLDAGRVIARGSPGDIRRDPAVAAAYLGREVDADGGGDA